MSPQKRKGNEDSGGPSNKKMTSTQFKNLGTVQIAFLRQQQQQQLKLDRAKQAQAQAQAVQAQAQAQAQATQHVQLQALTKVVSPSLAQKLRSPETQAILKQQAQLRAQKGLSAVKGLAVSSVSSVASQDLSHAQAQIKQQEVTVAGQPGTLKTLPIIGVVGAGTTSQKLNYLQLVSMPKQAHNMPQVQTVHQQLHQNHKRNQDTTTLSIQQALATQSPLYHTINIEHDSAAGQNVTQAIIIQEEPSPTTVPNTIAATSQQAATTASSLTMVAQPQPKQLAVTSAAVVAVAAPPTTSAPPPAPVTTPIATSITVKEEEVMEEEGEDDEDEELSKDPATVRSSPYATRLRKPSQSGNQ